MKAILHGTWTTHQDGFGNERFFVWAERLVQVAQKATKGPRIRRHPHAATTIEIAQLLQTYVPDTDWRSAERLTRVMLLPSGPKAPNVPRWLSGADSEASSNLTLQPWRVEGIGVSALGVLDVLAALPMSDNSQLEDTHRIGTDLRYWGLVAKYVLELLARQRFVPGLRSLDHHVESVWQPMLLDAQDSERFGLLASAMPPACRALIREGTWDGQADTWPAHRLLEDFVQELVDSAVRAWAPGPTPGSVGISRYRLGVPDRVGAQWWQSLWSEDRTVAAGRSNSPAITRFYQGWQSWTYQPEPVESDAFRLCFRLEPPSFDVVEPAGAQWVLHYFLQASDDPSLLVPAREVWSERGNVLAYLNRRFDNPQERLLAGLGAAARLCAPIRRSLRSEAPEQTTLSADEAYSFLRETARLLESSGFGVQVPPWWNKPDSRLHVKAKLKVSPEAQQGGLLGMNSLITYDWELALGDEVLTRDEFERLAALKTPLVQVRGRWVLLQPDQVEAAIAFWEKQRTREQLRLGDALALVLSNEPEIDGLAMSDLELDESLAELLSALSGGENLAQLEPPPEFVGQLRPYQIRGFSWLAFLRKWGFGACLADDMGLGKTIQAIALVLDERRLSATPEPSLVICPTSLVGNWRREVERFAPSLRVMVHHGVNRAEGDDFLRRSKAADLVISTYGLVRRDIDDLLRVHWAHIILDEAQNIKNPVTKQARAARRLEGDHRVALTGTPVENHLSELWSIMAFLNPGYLGSLDMFRRTWAIPIERYQDTEASEDLRGRVRPFVLRRAKTDPEIVPDLPEKFEQKVYCNLTREQATLYEAVVRDAVDRLHSLDGEGAPLRRRGTVLAMLTRLKQVCDHPALFLGDGSALASRSGKMQRLVEMLDEILSVGDRALVFTQYAQMGRLLQSHLQETFEQEVLFLHGGTSQKMRDRMLLRFQEDEYAPSVFVLSLKAGGTGLNLMRANHVFHYDRWWNPAVENQATDRAYRIGQTRDVQVHKFICLGTLEERVDALIESKRALAESVVSSGEQWLTELSTDELYELLALREEAVETE